MQIDPIAVGLALFVLLGVIVPAPLDWRRHSPAPQRGPGA